MKRTIAAICAVAIVLVLGGCATPPKQAFNAAANPNLLVIGVVTPPAPGDVVVGIVNHPGMQFGLIGGLVAAADVQAKTRTYQTSIAGQTTDWTARATAALKNELSKAGYAVVDLPVARAPKSDFLTTYPDSRADAFLDFKFGLMYMAATPTSDYMPYVMLSARLVDRATRAVLYEEQYNYGYPEAYGKPVHLPSDGKYRYANIDVLTSRAPESVEGLSLGLDKIAERVAQNLKPQAVSDAVAHK